MKTKTLLAALLSTAGTLSALPTQASEYYFEVEANHTYATYTKKTQTFARDDDGKGFALTLGKQFTPAIGLQLSAGDLGLNEQGASLRYVSTMGTLTVSVLENVSVHGGLGATVSMADFNTFKGEFLHPSAKLGVSYEFIDGVHVVGSYTHMMKVKPFSGEGLKTGFSKSALSIRFDF